MTVFYHVSTDLKHDGLFEPRIPSIRHQEQEDAVTPRISVAPSIADCLTAIPNGGGSLDELNMYQKGYYLVFRIDTEKLGISEKDIVTSQTLYEKDLVRDADFTNEHWIMVPFTVPKEDTFMIRLVDWEQEVEDILPHSIYAIADEEYDGDYLEAYRDLYNEHVPCSIRIRDIEYIHEEVEAGDKVTLYFEEDEEKEIIESYVAERLQAEITEISMDEIIFVMKEKANLRSLFMLHAEVAMLYI